MKTAEENKIIIERATGLKMSGSQAAKIIYNEDVMLAVRELAHHHKSARLAELDAQRRKNTAELKKLLPRYLLVKDFEELYYNPEIREIMKKIKQLNKLEESL